jgi:hypothetical protein
MIKIFIVKILTSKLRMLRDRISTSILQDFLYDIGIYINLYRNNQFLV